ncbi:hypothetical protein DL770_001741 [Monosporascus sp. CRB-9-2]|nr:hypothetical protein DL770_001741 [Monosporascus sp. CRB-9-2]
MAQLLSPNSTELFNFEWLRVRGMATFHGADVAECFEAASKIKPDDPGTWITTPAARLQRELRVYANGPEKACCINPRLLDIIVKTIDTFRKATVLFDSPVHVLEIPYENVRLPAYLYLPKLPPAGREKTPVIVQTSGFDLIQEEMHYFTAAGARARGYATLTFDWPGQDIVLLRDKLHMRPDWEVVVSAVLDQPLRWADERPEWNPDTSRVTIAGCSMGGYFALRGATDPRVKACVSSDGFYDFGLAVPLPDALAFGARSSSAGIRELQRYTVASEGQVSPALRDQVPVLVTGARDSIYAPTGRDRIYDGLTQLQDGRTEALWVPVGIGQVLAGEDRDVVASPPGVLWLARSCLRHQEASHLVIR